MPLNPRWYGRLWTVLVVIAAAILVAEGVYVRSVDTTLTASTGEGLALSAADLADDLERWQTDVARELAPLARTPALQTSPPATVTEMLDAARRGSTQMVWLGVVDASGQLVATTRRGPQDGTVETERWFRELRDARGGQVRVTPVEPGADGVPTVRFAAPLVGPEGQFAGALVAHVARAGIEAAFSRKIEAIQLQRTSPAHLDWELVTQSGVVVSDSTTGAPELRLVRALPAALFAEPPRPGYFESEDDVRGVPLVVGYARPADGNLVVGPGWRVLLAIDRADVLAPTRVILQTLAMATGLVILPLLMLLRWTTSQRRRLEQALHHTYDDLERRVAQRTAELTEARNAALQAAQAKSEFLANMSHEIRTPLTAILGFTNLLADPTLRDAERTAHRDTIRRNGEHLLSVINDILDLSKIEAGKLAVERVPCALPELLRSVSGAMRGRALEKGLGFVVEARGPLPETIRTDSTRLRQILINLLGNAIKFTEAGSVRLVARLGTGTQPRLCLDVVDTGIGLDPDVLSRLFLPFTQADPSTSRRFGGSGLGLAISRRLARMLGGDLYASSAPGRGSTFTAEIDPGPLAAVPMVDGGRLALDTPAAPPAATAGAPAHLRARILLAEDAPDSQRLLRHYLVRAGAQVDVVADGRLAASHALAAPYDLVLMDMQMPEMDGYAATAALRRAGYRGPIVALTAHAMDGDRDKCLAAGCDDFATKPIDPATLLRVAQRYCQDAPTPQRGDHAEGGSPMLMSDFAGPPLDDDPELRALVHIFIDGLPERARLLERSVDAGDLDRVAQLAHQLKGTAGGYGFPSLGEAAARLETSARTRAALDEVRGRVADVATLCEQARAAA
ncbi:MAG: response regulator [bacterium]|nr:response regulator [bacterium]